MTSTARLAATPEKPALALSTHSARLVGFAAAVALVIAPAVVGRRSKAAQTHARTHVGVGEDVVGVVVGMDNPRLLDSLPTRTGGTWAEPRHRK